MTQGPESKPAGKPQPKPKIDPFDVRPVIVIRPTEMAKTVWGVGAALSITASLGLLAAFLVKAVAHSYVVAAGCALAFAFMTAISIHTNRNPPSTVGLNVSTRVYQILKGSGRFRKSFRGSFDDIVGISVHTDESSHGVSGYIVTLHFTTDAGAIPIETHGINGERNAKERAAKLAGILDVAVFTEAEVKALAKKRA